MIAPLPACVVQEHRELAAQLAGSRRFEILRTYGPTETPDLRGVAVVFVEDTDVGSGALVRARAYAKLDPDVLLVSIVPEGIDPAHEEALRQSGSFDVIEEGPGLERALMRLAGMTRYVIELRAERARLASGLAHADRLAAIGLLAAGVGHEINNPSHAILANLEAVRADLEALLARPRFQQTELLQHYAPGWFESLGDCIGGCRRIASIVRSLTVFSRTTDQGPGPEPTILNDEISSVLRLVGKELRYQTRVELDLDPQLPAVIAPTHALTQVITNLVVNALQALQGQAPERRLLSIRTSHDEEVVMMEVRDTGPGMDAEVLARIFDPFFTTKPIGQGTGLGLSITQELVRKAGGEILVESEPGYGTTFRVVLPRPPMPARGPRLLSAPPPPLSRLRVLLVDDDELLLRALQRALQQDFECIAVSSGRAALELVRRHEHFDVIVSDVVMPDMNGLDLYEAVRAQDPGLAERSIFLSGGLHQASLIKRIHDTGRLFLNKPLSPRDLARRIHEIGLRA
ncbi:MAG: hypothetical protein OHK0013_44960 [Sandaracinaceae bacterium]